jgi:carbon storage regulator
MLILTRRTGEEIVIDGHIRIKVTSVRGDRVRLGIMAPESVCVDRAEVHECRGLGRLARLPGQEPPAKGPPRVQE